MTINVIAILAATVASYILGSLWYVWLGKSWRSAMGWAETVPPYRPSPVELAVGFIAQLVLAIALSGIIFHMGGASLRISLLSAFGIWLGFIMPTLSTNVVFQRRNFNLIWQDGFHWLVVLLAQGGVMGLLGS